MREVHLTLEAGDGHPLAATLYEPARPLAAVQINSATGVPRRYYAAYARVHAAQGFAVLGYDYRGLATLGVAGYVLSDGQMWVPVLDLRIKFRLGEARYLRQHPRDLRAAGRGWRTRSGRRA